MLSKVRALAFFLPLGSSAGDDTSLVPCRLLETLFVTLLKAVREVQASEFAEERHHFQFDCCNKGSSLLQQLRSDFENPTIVVRQQIRRHRAKAARVPLLRESEHGQRFQRQRC